MYDVFFKRSMSTIFLFLLNLKQHKSKTYLLKHGHISFNTYYIMLIVTFKKQTVKLNVNHFRNTNKTKEIERNELPVESGNLFINNRKVSFAQCTLNLHNLDSTLSDSFYFCNFLDAYFSNDRIQFAHKFLPLSWVIIYSEWANTHLYARKNC